jgi:hypothetical protein
MKMKSMYNFREYIIFFPKFFEPPIYSAQMKSQFASWMFNSNSVCNLSLLPKVKLFITIRYTLMQSLVNFGTKELQNFYFTKLAQFEK